MSRMKEKYYEDQRRNRMVGRFYNLQETGKKVPRYDICTVEEFEYKMTAKGRSKRSVKESYVFIEKLYDEKCEELKSIKANETQQETTIITLSQVIERYKRKIMPSKSKAQGVCLKAQLPYWDQKGGQKDIRSITPAWITLHRDDLEERYPHSTVNRFLSALSVVMTSCVKDWYCLEINPVLNVRKLKEPKGRDRYLDDEECKRFLAACQKDEELYIAVLLSLSTGARQKEVWNLKWKEIDLKNGSVTFRHTKNSEVRTIPIRGKIFELLKKRVRRLDTNCLFPGRIDPTKSREFRRAFKRALDDAKIENFRWHDLRHTAASYLIMSGVDIRTVAEILGHKTLAMTKRYTHLSPAHLGNAIEKMQEKFL